MYARGEGDARSDLDGEFESWFAKLAPLATREFGIDSNFSRSAEDEPLYRIEPVAASAVNAIVALGEVSPMKVLVNSELQNKLGANASERSTRHIEVQLPPGITYRVGDHLSVVPRNDPALVDSVARRFGFLPSDQIRLQVAEGRRAQLPAGEPVSVGRLLTDFVELQQVATRKQIQIMSEHTRCPVTKPKLLAYVGDDTAASERYRADILAKRKSVFDLLEEHPACELPFHAYLEMLSLLAPRYYSISSSPSVDPSRCSVTVGVVEGPASSGRGIYKGTCSNYLAGRRAGETIHATVRETRAGFRLPDDPGVPIIMVGPGTGLAPFRGFLQERAALKQKGAALGPAMLFFGCRHPDQDYLYADELKACAASGITELHTAFSRAEGPKTYVQNLVAAQKERVWSLIEKGAIIYVCGDGGKMEPDVKAALVAIYRERTGGGVDAAQRWIDDLGSEEPLRARRLGGGDAFPSRPGERRDPYSAAYRFERCGRGLLQQLTSVVMGPGVRRDDERFMATLPCRSRLPFRQSLERRQTLRDLMESLLVDGVDRHLRTAEESGIVERADLYDRRGQARPPRQQVRAAVGTEFPRYGAFEIAAGKLLGRSLGVAEAVDWHQHEHVGRAAGDVLAFAAVALRLHHRLALGHIAHLAAVASAFQFHDILPVLLLSPLNASPLPRPHGHACRSRR